MLTWITLQFTLYEIIWERTKLLHATYCDVLSTGFPPLFVKFIIHLQNGTAYYLNLQIIEHFATVITDVILNHITRSS